MDASRDRRQPQAKPFRRSINQNTRNNSQDQPRFGKKPQTQTSREPSRPVPNFSPRNPDAKVTNDMQVTDGKYKGVQLTSTASPKVRLTARRVREVLFEILSKRVRFARFLDLCAGSGIVGIEAVSRGASLCTFLERSAKMCHFINLNLQACQISLGHGEIVNLEAAPFLKRMAAREREWDIIFYGPPYEADYDEVLQFFARGVGIREKGGVLIIEHHAEMFFPEKLGVLERRRVMHEGDTTLTFYERG
jgi:16S rRNA (guanine(966)-N(2))-methyltransferase RsmD